MEPIRILVEMDTRTAIDIWEACADGPAGQGTAFDGIQKMLGIRGYRLKVHPEDDSEVRERRRAAEFLRQWAEALDVPEP